MGRKLQTHKQKSFSNKKRKSRRENASIAKKWDLTRFFASKPLK